MPRSKKPVIGAILVSVLIIAAAVAMLLVSGPDDSASLWGEKVGVVVVTGGIYNAGPTILALDKFRRNKSIKAVVLRVDSPGGSVAASQEIFREIRRTIKVKPVVCSMGSVAASGGYYIAAPCSKIVANPGTTTGSIGVISSLLNAHDLLQKLGISLQIVESGPYKSTGRIDRPLTEPQRAMLRTVLMDNYNQFVTDVARSRKLPKAKVRAIADGRIFTGRRAKELGLVDHLGNFHDAVTLAARLAGIKGRPTLAWPEDDSTGWLGRLLRGQIKAALRSIMAELGPSGIQYRYIPTDPTK